MTAAILLPALLAAAPIAVDRSTHSVTFTARATDVNPGATLEFAFVGPDSDRAYEAMFITDAEIKEIAQAFDDAGIPRGKPVGQAMCRFWPIGQRLEISPRLSDFISDRQGSFSPVLYTGGSRDAKDLPVAETNMPAAVFALYSLDQSLMLLSDSQDQSQVYGRYLCKRKLAAGERVTFKVSWNGSTGYSTRRLALEPGKIHDAISALKQERQDCDVLPVFSPQLTVSEARAAASALAVVDSRRVSINGFEEGQFFYRGFLPDEKWRDRTKRLSQPLEVHVNGTNVVFTLIDEDWSGEGLDPALTPHDEPIDRVLTGFKGDTCLFFVHAEARLHQLYSLMSRLPKSIRNWYVYID